MGLTLMRWQRGEWRGAWTTGPPGPGRGLGHPVCRGGERSRLGVDLGEARGEPGVGLARNLGIQTPGLALPTWVWMDGRASGAGQGPGTQVTLVVPNHLAVASGLLSSPLQRNPEARGHWKLSYSQNGPS